MSYDSRRNNIGRNTHDRTDARCIEGCSADFTPGTEEYFRTALNSSDGVTNDLTALKRSVATSILANGGSVVAAERIYSPRNKVHDIIKTATVAVEVGEGFGVVGDHGVEVEGLRVGEVGVGNGDGCAGPVGAEPAAVAVK